MADEGQSTYDTRQERSRAKNYQLYGTDRKQLINGGAASPKPTAWHRGQEENSRREEKAPYRLRCDAGSVDPANPPTQARSWLHRGRAFCRRRRCRRAARTGCGAATVRGIGKFYRARSRLYRSHILQENMRLKALAEIYKLHSFAQLCNLNFLSKQYQLFDASKFAKFSRFR